MQTILLLLLLLLLLLSHGVSSSQFSAHPGYSEDYIPSYTLTTTDDQYSLSVDSSSLQHQVIFFFLFLCSLSFYFFLSLFNNLQINDANGVAINIFVNTQIHVFKCIIDIHLSGCAFIFLSYLHTSFCHLMVKS